MKTEDMQQLDKGPAHASSEPEQSISYCQRTEHNRTCPTKGAHACNIRSYLTVGKRKQQSNLHKSGGHPYDPTHFGFQNVHTHRVHLRNHLTGAGRLDRSINEKTGAQQTFHSDHSLT